MRETDSVDTVGGFAFAGCEDAGAGQLATYFANAVVTGSRQAREAYESIVRPRLMVWSRSPFGLR